MNPSLDAVVVGAGPNGLAAAIALAQAGLAVRVLEAASTVGGGARTRALTLPGFRHDVCSAVHPLALASPFFRTLDLARHGVEWIHPPIPYAHPLDGGRAAAAFRSVDETAARLGPDGPAYQALFAPLLAAAERVFDEFLGPLRIPRSPGLGLRFAWRSLRSARSLCRSYFRTLEAQALLAGVAGHAQLPLDQSPSAAAAVVLGLAAHAVGWPIPRGGAQHLADALAAVFRQSGGMIETDRPVRSRSDLPPARAVLFDLTPRQILAIVGAILPSSYRRRLERFRYGMGVFKIDWALDGPIPWQNDLCRQAGTIHVGGTFAEIAAAERLVWTGQHPDQPYVLVVQPSLFDPSRAPPGRHVAWAYCHVPHASTRDMTRAIEQQVERFAPGFRDRILARHIMTTRDMQAYNANYVGGDINGGVQDLRQLVMRPVWSLHPYRMPVAGLYICSSSTPPGGGVHGLCGYFAAQSVLRDFRRRRQTFKMGA